LAQLIVAPMSDLDDAFHAAESLDPEDRMRLIARVWASLPEEYWAAPDVRERARVDSMLATGDTQGLADLPRQIARKLLSPPAMPPTSKIYSAPRRFDLATVFVVTFAYSLLFGMTSYVMSYLDFPAAWSLIVGGFVTLVAAAQALLFGGQNARVASIYAGVVLTMLLNLSVVIWPPRGFPGIAMIFLLPFSAVLGAGFGYMAGALVGGVFLVADSLRTHFINRQSDAAAEDVELEEVGAESESHAIT
jgi:hypothetical protein